MKFRPIYEISAKLAILLEKNQENWDCLFIFNTTQYLELRLKYWGIFLVFFKNIWLLLVLYELFYQTWKWKMNLPKIRNRFVTKIHLFIHEIEGIFTYWLRSRPILRTKNKTNACAWAHAFKINKTKTEIPQKKS